MAPREGRSKRDLLPRSISLLTPPPLPCFSFLTLTFFPYRVSHPGPTTFLPSYFFFLFLPTKLAPFFLSSSSFYRTSPPIAAPSLLSSVIFWSLSRLAPHPHSSFGAQVFGPFSPRRQPRLPHFLISAASPDRDLEMFPRIPPPAPHVTHYQSLLSPLTLPHPPPALPSLPALPPFHHPPASLLIFLAGLASRNSGLIHLIINA